MVAKLDHREFIAGLTDDQRRSLMIKSDRAGLLGLAFHGGAIVLLVWLIIERVTFWPVLVPLLGVLLVFLFTLLHETIHKTAFASEWLNELVARSISFLLLLPMHWFRYFHLAHHRHTQDSDKDPELSSDKPETVIQYFVHVSGIPVWISQVRTLLNNALGRCKDTYVPRKGRDKVRHEAQVMLAGYLLVACLAIFWRWEDIVLIWILPAILGQPFLRLYLLAEHGRCPLVANMFENTRTTFTNAMVRKLAWNMPYHAEHHAVPTVPFHKLPELHEIVHEHLRVTANGYVEFNRDYISKLTD